MLLAQWWYGKLLRVKAAADASPQPQKSSPDIVVASGLLSRLESAVEQNYASFPDVVREYCTTAFKEAGKGHLTEAVLSALPKVKDVNSPDTGDMKSCTTLVTIFKELLEMELDQRGTDVDYLGVFYENFFQYSGALAMLFTQ